jgi:hypothetical protein
VSTEQNSGDHTIAQTADGNTARARRSKHRTRAARRADRTQVTRPTRREASIAPGTHQSTDSRPTGRPATTRSSRRVPDWRAVPAPAPQVAGKRPAGQAPQVHPQRQAEVGPGPAHDRPHCPCRDRRPGAGWGFHRKVTATAVLPLGDYGPATAWPRPARERLNRSGGRGQSETLRR